MMETGLVAIEIVSKIHSVALDMAAVKRRYFVDRELNAAEVLRVLRDHGIRSRLKKLKTVDGLFKYPTPLIVISKINEFHILLGKKEERIFIFDCQEKKPKDMTEEEFLQMWSNEAIALYPRFTPNGILSEHEVAL